MGLQLSTDLSDGLSVVAQLTAQGANDFDAEIEWLYISYNISNELNAKAGRQRYPFYAYSDYLDVGYAYHWIRPPQDVYSLAVSSYEGISLRYDSSLGDWDTSILGYYGASDNDKSSLMKIDTESAMGLALTGTYDWLELRVAYHELDIEVPDFLVMVQMEGHSPKITKKPLSTLPSELKQTSVASLLVLNTPQPASVKPLAFPQIQGRKEQIAGI